MSNNRETSSAQYSREARKYITDLVATKGFDTAMSRMIQDAAGTLFGFSDEDLKGLANVKFNKDALVSQNGILDRQAAELDSMRTNGDAQGIDRVMEQLRLQKEVIRNQTQILANKVAAMCILEYRNSIKG